MVLNFGLMMLAGFSLNIFSLGGLVVAIGEIGGLLMEMAVALFLMPCLYLLFNRRHVDSIRMTRR